MLKIVNSEGNDFCSFPADLIPYDKQKDDLGAY